MPNKVSLEIDGQISSSLRNAINELKSEIDNITSSAGNVRISGSVSSQLGGTTAGAGGASGSMRQTIRTSPPAGASVIGSGMWEVNFSRTQDALWQNQTMAMTPAQSRRAGMVGRLLSPGGSGPSGPNGAGGAGGGGGVPPPYAGGGDDDAGSSRISQLMSLFNDTAVGRYAFRFSRGAMLAVGSSIQHYAQAATNQVLTGRPDYMAQAAIPGSLIGGLVGAGVGSIFPGWGSVIGAGIGSSAGTSISQFFSADLIKNVELWHMTQPSSGAWAAYGGQYGGYQSTGGRSSIPDPFFGGSNDSGYRSGQRWVNPSISRMLYMGGKAGGPLTDNRGWFERTAEGVRNDFWMGNTEYAGTAKDMADVYDQAVTSFRQAGIDPFEMVGSTVGYDSVDVFDHYDYRKTGTRRVRRPVRRSSFSSDVFDYYNHRKTGTWQVRRPVRRSSFSSDSRSSSVHNTVIPRPMARYDPKIITGLVTAFSSDLSFKGPLTEPGRSQWISDSSSRRWSTRMDSNEYEWVDEDVYSDVPVFRKEMRYRREQEERAMAEARKADILWGASAPQMYQQARTVRAGLPDTGGNPLDIMLRHGSTAAYAFSQLETPLGQAPPMSMRDMDSYSAMLRGGEHNIRKASYMARGGGLAAMSASQTQMDTMSKFSGYQDSEAYAAEGVRFRNATLSAMDESNIETFGMEDVRLTNLERRLSVMPFAPGNRMAVGLQHARLRKAHGAELRSQMAFLKNKGQLTAAQEMQMMSEIEEMDTQNAIYLGSLSEDMPNRLPALAAGVPSAYGRFTSNSLAAMNLGAIGFPGRLWGAANGRQANMQRQYFAKIAGDMDIGPNSRTQTFNSTVTDGRAVNYLERMTKALEKIASSPSTGGTPLSNGRPGQGDPKAKPWSGSQ